MIGSLLLVPSDVPRVASVLRAEHFADPERALVFGAICRIVLRDDDVPEVKNVRAELQACGTPVDDEFLEDLDCACPPTPDVLRYARTVVQHASWRKRKAWLAV